MLDIKIKKLNKTYNYLNKAHRALLVLISIYRSQYDFGQSALRKCR